ncbi:hypothetical protein QYE76_065345 [Lolium multiflorum]|uniref:Integrase catalytic domain-containing protein n=1 Tax=Lolium multiflorum TaxID=4521 RepID=A0AAD8W9X4_LOLMU|nr:hypothetical protein QYE76_065345 [Lolium multiflorum]
MRKFCDDMGIKLIRSSPYYAQANGQAEASNKSLIKLIKRKIDEHPRRWHEVLSEALWAYRMSCHGAIKTTPYQLVYGQEAVLPWEVKAGSRRVTFQNDLTAEEYAALISDSIEDATELRLWSLEKIKENKAKVARAYNKKVKPKEFQVGDLVWEAVLPLGTRDKEYGKWSPNWHGPYKVVQVLKGNAYMLEMLDGVKFPVAVNGQHLKKYFPSRRCAIGFVSSDFIRQIGQADKKAKVIVEKFSSLIRKDLYREEPIAQERKSKRRADCSGIANPTGLIFAGFIVSTGTTVSIASGGFSSLLPRSSAEASSSSSSSSSLSAQLRKRFVGGYPAEEEESSSSSSSPPRHHHRPRCPPTCGSASLVPDGGGGLFLLHWFFLLVGGGCPGMKVAVILRRSSDGEI